MEITGIEEIVLDRMEQCFGSDAKRIEHARRVAGFADELLKKESGRREVVIIAALLHDIGIHECERKYRSTDGQLQEKEGVPIARKILVGCNVEDEIIDEVCRIIGSHHSPGEVETDEFKIMWDADWLVNLNDECDLSDKKKVKQIIDKVFLTKTGRAKAEEIYCDKETR